ncbi:hypothetical protein [Streptomyces mirabilis]|uniref:hypothetical protein n=1 Tax=Streptomyces mirabilis TaxID=68239 RepID=UPI00331A2BB1
MSDHALRLLREQPHLAELAAFPAGELLARLSGTARANVERHLDGTTDIRTDTRTDVPADTGANAGAGVSAEPTPPQPSAG